MGPADITPRWRRLAAAVCALTMLSALAAPVADAQQNDPAARFFVDDTLTFAGLSSTSTFAITPSPGESITALTARVVSTADAADIIIDTFVNDRLIDSKLVDAAVATQVTLSLGEIVATSVITVRLSHRDDECRNDDGRIVELADLAFVVDGLPQRPVGPQDFFPPHLSRVVVAMEKPNDADSQAAALDAMSRLAARYRRDDFSIEAVTLAELEFLQPDERAIIIDYDIELLAGPELSKYGPKVLRIHPVAGIAHLESMLELTSPPANDDVFAYVGDLASDLSAQGITSASVDVEIAQTVFSRIPDRYTLRLTGWSAMSHSAELGAQTLSVTADEVVVHTQTITGSGPFAATFDIDEPARDVDVRVTLRGPDIGEACHIQTAALQLALDPDSTISPIGHRDDRGFGSLPQGFEGIWSIDADEDGWPRAARLMTLVQRPSSAPLTVTEHGAPIRVALTSGDAVLTTEDGGLFLTGGPAGIDALLDAIEEESWYALEGDIARVGGAGLVTQYRQVDPLVVAGLPPEVTPVPTPIPTTAPIVEIEPTDDENETAATVASAEFEPPPTTLAFADDGRKDFPGSAIAGAAVLTVAGGILVNRRDTLLGRRAGGS